MSDFSKFTNLYSLSKTLRFELKPVGNTERMLQENNIFVEDGNRKKAYESTKPYLDRLHREFIKETLEHARLDNLDDYFKIFQEYHKDPKNETLKKQINQQKARLREQIVKFFYIQGTRWANNQYSHLKIKKKDHSILFEKEVFQILKDRYGNEKDTKLIDDKNHEISIFDGWEGFTGYFSKFFETRKNLYKSDGTSTALATRMIDQNLDRFLNNLIQFNSIKDKLDFSEVEEFFKLRATDVFSIDFYNSCLLQEGIDRYNAFIGGKTLENGEKKKGINEIINKYKQDHPGSKIPFLKKLDKQILSEKEKFIKEIETPEEFTEILETFKESAINKISIIKKLLDDFFQNTSSYSLNGIFITKEALNTISLKWTNEPNIFFSNLYEVLKSEKVIKSSAKKKDGSFSFPDFISLSYIQSALNLIPNEIQIWKERYEELLDLKESHWQQFLKIFHFEFNNLFQRKVMDARGNIEKIYGFDVYKSNLEEILKDFKINKESKFIVKNFADSVLHTYQMAKYFALEKKRSWDTEYDDQLDQFYTDPEIGYLRFYENAYEEIVQAYNKIRNYLTRKPYSEEKWKLNFDNPTFANGWDRNKERDNSALIFRKGNEYFLGVMRKGHNDIFLEKNRVATSESNSFYEKLVYKLFPDPSKMMPKVCFSKKGLEFFNPPQEIYEIYKKSEFKKGDTFSVDNMQKLIKFYIQCLKTYPGWKDYNFTEIKDPKDYCNNIGEFFNDVARSGYKIWFVSIGEEYIKAKNESGELFLFQIYNQDFGKKSTGTKNLHTLYFEELFSEVNKNNNFPFKLNGQAEVFFRPKTPAEKLGYKKDKKNKDVVNRKRYVQDKILFHVPITLNRVPKGIYKFNTEINDTLANNPNINIIGIDRGEKHLAYYSVINQKGEILEDGTLNVVNNVDYYSKLSEKAENREQARKDWQEIEGIKDLKKGYISQVVRKLADLAIKYNAIIVIEDLNMRFKQIRGGIEKSVYQQLEKALIEKLNFLVNKNETNPEKAGHLLKAYQLTAPFTTFKDMGKQTGIIFYTQASYTSKIDPVTGWRPNLYLKYSSAEKTKADILKFKEIKFENNKFNITYDLKDFLNLKEYPEQTERTVSSNVERFHWNRKSNNNKGGYEHYNNITDNLKQLFLDYKIDYTGNIKKQIEMLDIKGNERFFKDFIFYFKLICQIRNTQQDKEGDENDFILSPVEPYFDSRNPEKFGKHLPKNGDANGAYNIARKGIIILDKISRYKKENGSTDKMKWDDLYISHIEWDNFVTPKKPV